MLVNALPGDPSCFPRDGIPAWNSTSLSAAPTHIFPWADLTTPKVILHIGTSLYWAVAGSAVQTLIAAALVPAEAILSAIRVKDMMFININLIGASHYAWILAWNGTTFTIRNANIARPTFTLAATPVAGGNITAQAWKSYAFTLVNRNDAASVDGTGAPKLCRLQDGNFHPGLLESIDDIDNRKTFQNTNVVDAQAAHLVIDKGGATLDTQATHLRVYATEENTTEIVATGLSHRWIADLPIIGVNAYAHPYTYDDITTVGQMTGALDIDKMVGFESIPPGTYMLYHQGIIWVGGVGAGEDTGRNFYSQIPLDVEFPQKWWSMHKTGTNFKDTSYEDSEPGTGIALANNDVYFFGRRSVWYLRDGDIGYEPTLVDKNKGTTFPNSITSVNKDIFYISNEGPATIAMRQVEALSDHTAGEVWPKIHDNSVGYFFNIADRTKVKGFYYRESWFLTDGVKLIGFYMPSKSTAIGPWSVEPGSPAVGFDLVAVLEPDSVCVLVSSSMASPKLWHFLKAGVSADNALDFWLKGSSKACYVNGKNRDMSGELYLLKMFVHFEDLAILYITIISDFFRFKLEMEYNEYDSASQLVSPEADVSFRNVVEQPIPDGLVGQFFEIEWRKRHQTPYAFTNKGWILEYKPIVGHPSEFISKSDGDGLILEFPNTILYLKFDEDANSAADASLYQHNHAYAAGTGGSRAFDSAMVPAGGQSLVRGSGSGYIDSTWNGMDYIGDASGFNSEDLTYEYVVAFPSLVDSPIIEEGGDGTYFWRLLVNADGSLEYQIHTSAMAYKFNTSPGSIVASAGVFYTIQFVLSNGGLNGQFYASPRVDVVASLLTTRSAL